MCRSREWVLERIWQDRRVDAPVSRRTPARRGRGPRKVMVRALAHPVPPVRRPPPRVSGLEPVEGLSGAILREDTAASGKRTHAVGRGLRRLTAGRDFRQASYATVRDCVRGRRAGTGLEARQRCWLLVGAAPR